MLLTTENGLNLFYVAIVREKLVMALMEGKLCLK